jgi:TP901 family phage tail tape measure protein
MPLQVGTMMVVVRAQDFASRTIRRVGGELEGLSRAQAMAMRGDMVAQQKRMAESYVRTAEANMQALRTVDRYRQATVRQATALTELSAAEAALNKQRAIGVGAQTSIGQAHGVTNLQRQKGLRLAQQEIAVATQEWGFFRKMADWANRNPLKLSLRPQIASPEKGMLAAQTRMQAGYDQLAKQSRSLAAGQDIANLERRVGQLRARYNQASSAVTKLGGEISRMPGWLRNAATSQFGYNQALEKANRELGTAYYNLDKATKAQIAFNNAMRAMPAQRLADIGHALSGIGRTFQLIGLIGTSVFAAASNSFANFNRELTVAATQTVPVGAGIERVTKNTTKLNEAILGLMTKFPATAVEMSQAAYDIYSSMDVSFGGGIDLLKRFNQVAVATLTDLETATSAGITVLNNFGGSAGTIDKTLNLMVATVRFGRMRLEDFNTMLNKVAPAAASAGNSLEDVAGAMALITTRQPSQRQAATGIARLFQVFQDPDFQQGIRNASDGIVDIVKEGGGLKSLPVIVNDIANAFEEVSTKKGAAQLFRQLTAVGRGSGRGLRSTIEAQRAWTFLFKNLQDYNMLQGKVIADTKELARSYKVMAASPGVRWQVLINQMRMLVLVIGEKAIPVFLRIGDIVSDMVNRFRRLDGGTRDLIVRLATWGFVATLIGGVLLGIAGPIIALIAHFKRWKMGLGQVEARIITLGAVMRALPLGILTGVLAQFIGWKRAIQAMIIAWLAWKAIGIGAAVAVAIAHRGAAASVALAWRAALRAIPGGLIIVGLALAADYVITHWEKVRMWFIRFYEWLQIQSYEVAYNIGKAFDFLPGKVGQHFTDMRQNAEEGIRKIELAQYMRKETAQTEKVMDAFLNNQPKKFRAYRKKLMDQLKTGEFSPGTNRASIREELKIYNDALKRMRQAKKKFEEEGFSEDFWKILGAKNLEDFSKKLQKMYDTQVDGASEAADYQKQLTETQAQAADQAVSTLRNMYMQMEQENRGFFGALFQGPWLTSETFDLAKEWGITPRIQDMIKDLHQQNAQFATWRSSLDKLLKKGLPAGFIDELRQMGPEEGQPILNEIMSAKPSQVNKLISEWKAREQQIKKATKMDFSREINAFKKAGGDMGRAMIEGFETAEVGKWFDSWVKVTFPNVINAAVTAAVADWKKANPKPTTAKPEQRPKAPNTTAGSTNNNDNSKKITVNVYPEHAMQNERNQQAAMRQAAFVAKNVLAGWL